MAGKRQPTDLLIVKGKKHLTKKEIEERKNSEVKATADKVEAPSYLTTKIELKEEFDRLASELIDIGIMSNLDTGALARYVVVEYEFQQVTERLLKLKTIGTKFDELLQRQDKLFKMARSAASDLGLTISSRCRLVIPKAKDEKPKNKFSKFM